MTELIITSSVLILVVIVLRHFLKGKISLRLQYALWALVLLRLLVPVALFESPFSVMNAVLAAKSAREVSVASAPTPTLSSAYGDMGAENAAVQGGVGQNVTDSVTNVTHHVFHWGLLAQRVWYIGIGIVGMTLLLSNLSFGRKLRKTRKAYQADDCKLPVYTVDALPSPCLFGLFHPSIYITSEVAGDETKLRHVLAHELTHYRHGDHIWAALRGLCLAVHWYNPLVWLAAALSRRDSELACDEGTIKRIGEGSRMEYGRTLIGLTCEKRKAMDLLCCATTMTDGKNGIKERIALIAQKPKLLIPAVIAVMLVAVVAVGCTFTGAKNDAEIVPLTAEELTQYSKAFEPLLYDEQGNPISVNPLSNFLTSYYDRPEDINLAELLRYFSSDGDVKDEAEFESLKVAENWSFGTDMTLDGMPVPVHKFSVGTVNKALKEYMGITLDDLSGVGLDELIYLKAYDAYYNFTSDAGAASFTCTSGEKQGDIVRLFGDTATLTLKIQGDGFLIVSHQLAGGAASGGIDSGNVTLYDCSGLSVAIPNEYIQQLVVIADPESEAAEAGVLVSVYEKQSYEESRADYGEEGTAGFLFSIVRYTQAQYEQFLCSDGSGYSFFAKDNTYYYGWVTATDVQFYRSGGQIRDTDSDEWKAWEALYEGCNAIKDDFIARNHLTAYSDSEFQSKQFIYTSEHLYLTYYPYYAYQDTATAQGFTWQDVAYKLVLSQPATQGETGIWCVERWYDEHGSLYLYFPNANGVPAAQYYAEEQAQCDAGHKVSALDPEQVALEFVRQYFGHTEATFESIVVQGKASADEEPIASADINNDGLEEAFYLDKTHMGSGDIGVTLRVYDGNSKEIWSENAGLPHVGWNSLFLCKLDEKTYLLRYNPSMYQGDCTYTYTLFTLEGGSEKVYQTNTLEFDINGTKALDASGMVAFADEVNALLAKSTLLLSSEGGTYSFGPVSADGFMEEFSWLEEDPNLKSLYLPDDDLQTKLEKFSEHAVLNHG
ncbi:MAG: M56 family metallopeptidase [Clostridiales bacterium]|nr:M56 family metallopeptidase [Clostridiales bacterium]